MYHGFRLTKRDDHFRATFEASINFLGRSWENRMRVNRKRGNRGHESIVNKLVINGKIVFKFVK